MSDYSHNKGIIYPLPKMTEEERDNLEFSLKDPFSYEAFEGRNGNINHYLFFSLYHTYGQRSDNFGSSRKCTAKEIAQYAPMFAEVLGKEIDTDKLKYIEFCWYNCCECQDYYEDEPEISETDAIKAAIQHFKTQAPRNCGVMYEQYTAVAEWLTELQNYKDETPITRDYLKSVCNNLKTNDYIELSFGEYDEDDFYILVKYINDVHEMCTEYDPVMQWKCPVHTVGQLKMFLTICGLQDFVKQLKS